jgi:hypothetical protein
MRQRIEHELAAGVPVTVTAQRVGVPHLGPRRSTRLPLCPECGTTVFFTTESAPELIAVPVGAFADPGFPAPRVSVREERRHSWLDLPGVPGESRHQRDDY